MTSPYAVLRVSMLLTVLSAGVIEGRTDGLDVAVLVEGRAAVVYEHRGTRYIEAVKGREYAIRLHNPLDVRVAVALSVDGLNTIDARRTTAERARKWVLGPHETITISGWQTSRIDARRFYFTSEARSYAQSLGAGENLGIISVAFFRERVPRIVPISPGSAAGSAGGYDAEIRRGADGAGRRGDSAPPEEQGAAAAAPMAAVPRAADDYAATGIGRRTEHRVEQVAIDLEPTPVATVSLRYEYRAQLETLGVLTPHGDGLARRRGASGFEPGFCPEPPRRSWPNLIRQNWK